MSVNGNQQNNESGPLVKAHFIRFLVNRPRLIDQGVRKDLLKNLQQDIETRRNPSNVAKRTVSTALDRTRNATERTASTKMESILTNANRGPIEHI